MKFAALGIRSSLFFLLVSLASANLFTPGEDQACNAGLMTVTCTPWTSKGFDTTNEVIINCGECVEITDTIDINLLKGIDIRGRLRLAPPSDKKITITTSHVLVEGVLSIDTPYAPGPDETVSFIMTNPSGTDHFYTGFGDNAGACGGSCPAGKRGVVVGGGRLDVNGLPSNCATWKRLESLGTVGVKEMTGQPFVPLSAGCSLTAYRQDFEGSLSNWFGKDYGLFYTRTDSTTGNKYLEAVNRIRIYQGIGFHLDDATMSCVTPDVVYTFSFRVKLHSNNDVPSNCVANGNNCPYIGYNRRACDTNSCPHVHKGLGKINAGFLPNGDDVWYPMTGEITFTADDLATGQYYRYFYVDGMEAGVDIAMDDFEISRPGASYFPTANVCADLVRNGDASLGNSTSPYPFVRGDGRAALVVLDDPDGNRFFRLAGRQYMWSSIRFPIAVACLDMEVVYRISLKTRASTALSYIVRLLYVFKDDAGVNQYRGINFATCTTGVNVFAECTGEAGINKPEIFMPGTQLYLDQYFLEDSTTTVDFDDFKMEFVSGPVGSFVIEADGVDGCWTAGSEVLLTSDTMYYEDDTLATIKTVTPDGEGFVKLEFVEALSPRSTKQDGYPIELALMERNIKFESDSDALSEGGQLVVWMTPGVQKLDGVEFHKFGQQGILGRYPIHWHMCGSVDPGTIAKRNLIRDSNQRCIVIHGTHNLTVSENVARENFGHCFLLEDGGERDNHVLYNLAAYSKHMNINPPLRGGIDNDDHATSYWITNPQNTYVGNVAAGGQGSGFWYELNEVKSPSVNDFGLHPRYLSLTQFENNTAHSYRSNGFRVYPNGYRPYERAWFVNTKSYKNHWDGMFFHNSWHLGVRGALLADNRRGINIDRADDIYVQDVDIIGQTESHQVALTRTNRNDHCPSTSWSKWGIKIHSFLFSETRGKTGPTIENVRFHNISDSLTGCTGTAAVLVDSREVRTNFNSWTKISQVGMSSSVGTKFDTCDAVDEGVKDIIIEIADSSMYGSPGYLVSRDQPELTTFLPTTSCTNLTESCLLFCSGACYRSLKFLVEPDITVGVKLRVRDTTSDKTTEFGDGGYSRSDPTFSDTYRIYLAHLPPGNYEISFIEGSTAIYPTIVLEDHLPQPDCMSGQAFTYTILEPTASCGTLISSSVKNGNFEANGGSLQYWKHRYAGIALDTSNGYDGSTNSGAGIRSGSTHIGQYLDLRCMTVGSTFEITGRMLSFNSDGTTSYACDPNAWDCRATLFFEHRDPVTGETTNHYRNVARSIDSTDPSDWVFVHGLVTIDDMIANSIRVFLYFQTTTQYGRLDNAQVVSYTRPPNTVLLNGDFETGDHRYWVKGDPLLMHTPGADGTATAVKTNKLGGYIQQFLDTSTLTAGTRYLFSARFKLLEGSGWCDVNLWWGDTACPKLMLHSTFKTDTDRDEWKGHMFSVAPYTLDAWNTMWGYVTITDAQATADNNVRFHIGAGPKDTQLVIDEVTMTPVSSDCTSLVVNGGAEYGDARGWIRRGAGQVDIYSNGSSGSAIVIHNREKTWNGVEQNLDVSCIVVGATYRVTAKFKMENESTVLPHACVTGTRWGDDACPILTFAGSRTNMNAYYLSVYNTLTDPWVADGFNDFVGEIVIPQELADSHTVKIYNERPPAGISIIMDELTVALVTA